MGGLTKRFITLLAGLALVASACSSNDSADGASCAEVADEAIGLIQDLVDEVSAMSVDEIFAAGDTVPGIEDFDAKGDELQAKANDAGCSDSEMQSLMNARAGSLESDSEFGQLIIDSIQSDGLFSE